MMLIFFLEGFNPHNFFLFSCCSLGEALQCPARKFGCDDADFLVGGSPSHSAQPAGVFDSRVEQVDSPAACRVEIDVHIGADDPDVGRAAGGDAFSCPATGRSSHYAAAHVPVVDERQSRALQLPASGERRPAISINVVIVDGQFEIVRPGSAQVADGFELVPSCWRSPSEEPFG